VRRKDDDGDGPGVEMKEFNLMMFILDETPAIWINDRKRR